MTEVMGRWSRPPLNRDYADAEEFVSLKSWTAN
jgi:hypothetical protein